MPFTFAHPAAVLPLRRWMPLPALVAGSIAPDAAYFLPIRPDDTHSLTAALGFDVVLGLALLGVFAVLRAPLVTIAPSGLQLRLGAFPGRARPISPVGVLITVVSIAVGALTHVLWDMLTHPISPVVELWPWFRAPVVGSLRLFSVIGYASSIGGLVVLAVAVARWYRRTPPEPVAPVPVPALRRRWVAAALASGGLAGAAVGLSDPGAWADAYSVGRTFVIGATQGGALVLGGHALLWHAMVAGERAGRRPDRDDGQAAATSGER